MLRKDARKIKSILRILYNNVRFFKLKGDNVIMKPRVWSLSKETLPLMALITDIVPSEMAKVDMAAATAYTVEVENLKDTSDFSAICKIAYNHFTTFVQRYQFKGIQYDFPDSPFSIRRTLCNIGSQFAVLRKRTLIKQTVKSIPERLKSMEEIIAEEINVTCQEVGRIITGNPKFDNQYQQIMRYTSIPKAYL